VVVGQNVMGMAGRYVCVSCSISYNASLYVCRAESTHMHDAVLFTVLLPVGDESVGKRDALDHTRRGGNEGDLEVRYRLDGW
jgi:hypothetical protein